ncbi:FIST C-terminal domain-containing protein [filamentous cyanobacterium LEGE 11480]|uniref:FIST C-terminal domain-containing protein n=1 Tax=Romeriopsis navalis LEGE 11480 TaxID=2777977 RepID=A0A928Z512_9CYAN|nr:FIST C-terminal domain-containing protein [Romeriopsis navalis]MBE9031577.1 FIST C-terminal domain-containing protein [Romeriopsis navalis LEGE 11480]
MSPIYLDHPTPTAIVTAAQKLGQTISQAKSSHTIFMFLGEHHSLELEPLLQQLNTKQIQFIGGIFPAVISGHTKSTDGAVIMAMPTLGKPYVIHGLDQAPIELPEFSELATIDKQVTTFLLVDGLTSNIGLLLSEMYDYMGNEVHYLGGGAGSLSLTQQPCVFSNSGIFQDAAIVSFINWESHLGVKHGWERIKGPIISTSTQNNIIKELNWQSAFDLYREVVQDDASTRINADNFFDVAKGYPFGLLKEGQEDVVRDPIVVNEAGHLICVGEVPENASLYILKGDSTALIAAARQAAQAATASVAQIQNIFVVDCISRVLFLEDQFSQELQAIQVGIQSESCCILPVGILTLGEISSYGEGYLEFFNKTIVVAAMYSS